MVRSSILNVFTLILYFCKLNIKLTNNNKKNSAWERTELWVLESLTFLHYAS